MTLKPKGSFNSNTAVVSCDFQLETSKIATDHEFAGRWEELRPNLRHTLSQNSLSNPVTQPMGSSSLGLHEKDNGNWSSVLRIELSR